MVSVPYPVFRADSHNRTKLNAYGVSLAQSLGSQGDRLHRGIGNKQ